MMYCFIQVKVFVGLMRRAGINIEVFWDGPLVPKFKEQVLRKRNEEVLLFVNRLHWPRWDSTALSCSARMRK